MGTPISSGTSATVYNNTSNPTPTPETTSSKDTTTTDPTGTSSAANTASTQISTAVPKTTLVSTTNTPEYLSQVEEGVQGFATSLQQDPDIPVDTIPTIGSKSFQEFHTQNGAPVIIIDPSNSRVAGSSSTNSSSSNNFNAFKMLELEGKLNQKKKKMTIK